MADILVTAGTALPSRHASTLRVMAGERITAGQTVAYNPATGLVHAANAATDQTGWVKGLAGNTAEEENQPLTLVLRDPELSFGIGVPVAVDNFIYVGRVSGSLVQSGDLQVGDYQTFMGAFTDTGLFNLDPKEGGKVAL